MVSGVRSLGMEVCCTLGMITQEQANQLAEAGLSAYNHNLDSSREFYKTVLKFFFFLNFHAHNTVTHLHKKAVNFYARSLKRVVLFSPFYFSPIIFIYFYFNLRFFYNARF